MKRFIQIMCVIVVFFIIFSIEAFAKEINNPNFSISEFKMVVLTAEDTEQADQASDIWLEVPLYFQTDYPNTPYPGGTTVASDGCGITCLAMVATYLTDTEYLPDELAERFRDAGKDNAKRMEAGIKELGLPFEGVSVYWSDALSALQNGQVVIVLVGGDSYFTGSAHFIVLTKMTEDGRIFVNDPYEPNYSSYRLAKGFEIGFTQNDFLRDFRGAWIFGKKESND